VVTGCVLPVLATTHTCASMLPLLACVQVRGTLVLLPLVYRCRAMGCVYLLAPWDIHAELGKAALQEMAALLASGGSQWGGLAKRCLWARHAVRACCGKTAMLTMALPVDTRQRCE
jgi:hypothetical protein